MIPARKDPFRDSLLYLYLKSMLRRNFHTVRIAGLHHLQSLEKTRPAIAFANHTNWWDGLLVFYLTRFQSGKDFYCMMEEKQMRHYPFFAWMGAFSVDLDNSIRAAATVRYACELLRNNRTLIWIFPQGKMVSPYEPISIRPGVDFMAKRYKNAQMMPMAMHFNFEREQHPFAYMRIGKPFLAADSSEERLADEMEVLRKEIQEDVRQRHFEEYEYILKPALSINKRWEWIRRACTGRLSGFERDN
jgi:1-acyl-sn-glycerol-3-phosphate acyltransferase